jgi:hypothetical protein
MIACQYSAMLRPWLHADVAHAGHHLTVADIYIVGLQEIYRVPPLVARVHQVAGGFVFGLDALQRIHQKGDLHYRGHPLSFDVMAG